MKNVKKKLLTYENYTILVYYLKINTNAFIYSRNIIIINYLVKLE